MFDRNINVNRDVKFLECDYLLVQRCVKLTLSSSIVHCTAHMFGYLSEALKSGATFNKDDQ